MSSRSPETTRSPIALVAWSLTPGGRARIAHLVALEKAEVRLSAVCSPDQLPGAMAAVDRVTPEMGRIGALQKVYDLVCAGGSFTEDGVLDGPLRGMFQRAIEAVQPLFAAFERLSTAALDSPLAGLLDLLDPDDDALPFDLNPDDCWRCDAAVSTTELGLCAECLATLVE